MMLLHFESQDDGRLSGGIAQDSLGIMAKSCEHLEDNGVINIPMMLKVL